MTDLRKAAEMALEALKIWEKMQPNTTACAVRIPAIQALRQALEQPEHEPVAWVIEDGEVDYYVDVVAKIKPGTPLYTAPPKREWVGLTRDEVLDIEETTKHPLAFYGAIEAKLKEKNA